MGYARGMPQNVVREFPSASRAVVPDSCKPFTAYNMRKSYAKRIGMIKMARMFTTLIIGFTAGPAVSL